MNKGAETEINRRIANIMTFGTIEEVNLDSPPQARVRVGELLTGWLRMAAPRTGADKVWAPFEVGEEVVISSLSGDMREGVILSSLYNGVNGASGSAGVQSITYSDGSQISYERDSHKFTINLAGGSFALTAPEGITIESGSINVEADTTSISVPALTIEAPGGVTIKGNLTVAGSITTSGAGGSMSVNGDISMKGNMTIEGEVSASEDVKSGEISLKAHTHSGVVAGGDKSGEPS